MKSKFIFSVIVIAAVFAVVLLGFGGSKILETDVKNEKPISIDANKSAKIGLPEFAQKTTRVEEAYIYAMMNQDLIKYLACYCGCANMQHSDNLLSHKSLKDCYIRSDGSFEQHASECKLCNDITLEAKELLGKGYSLKEVRTIIDDRYSGRGIGTNTPLPP